MANKKTVKFHDKVTVACRANEMAKFYSSLLGIKNAKILLVEAVNQITGIFNEEQRTNKELKKHFGLRS